MRIVGIVQARMASTRLPGKVLVDLGGAPLLERVVARARLATRLDEVVVATSDTPADDAIADWCRRARVPCIRGSEHDVLDRFMAAARASDADVIVRLTADCPLLDPAVIDAVVARFDPAQHDYVSNSVDRSYPDGLDTEVVARAALERAWREARLASEREHVTPYIWKHPDRFRLAAVRHSADLSSLRWTVDTPADLVFARAVYAQLPHPAAGMDAVLDVLARQPELRDLNAGGIVNEGYYKSLAADRAVPSDGGSGAALYRRARQLIPGGTQLLSKRPEMFLPERWPSYYSRARGVDVWDLDGRHYVDMSYNAIGACVLGAADPDVDAAVRAAIDAGTASTLNCPEEVRLAELMCELHPWAQQVRYARSGGEAMALAVRIARASTRRDRVAFCGYHGWHDWYLAANLGETDALDGHLLKGLAPRGVPRGLRGTALPFRYNNVADLDGIVAEHASELAAIVMEPIRDHDPDPGFLAHVRTTASRIGAVLVIDEITAGFRLTAGGVHMLQGFEPDIAVFAKAISNGYPMAVVLGRAEVMQAAQSSFISSTHWTERIGPAAAIATIEKFRRVRAHEWLIDIGARVQEGWRAEAARAALPIEVGGIKPLSHFSIPGADGQAAATLFTRLMLDRGFLAGKGFYATFAHQPAHVDAYVTAVREVFAIVARALRDGNISELLDGPPAHAGFTRLT